MPLQLQLAPSLIDARFGGLRVESFWVQRLAALGYEVTVLKPAPGVGILPNPHGRDPWLDGRYLALDDETLAEALATGSDLHARDGAIVLRTPGNGPDRLLLEDEGLGVDGPDELLEAERRWNRRRVARWVESGVLILAPDHLFVDATVTIGAGAVIDANVVLRGKTTVGPGVQLGPGVVLFNTEVGADAVVKAYTVAEGAKIGPRCSVGPMAHLRAGTVLEESAKIGNFVETKSVRVGRGAKASHLTYLGDAVVGPNANIGAGTITCNYDGYAKHQTQIGEGAFIGSNTSLVAPVSVGAGAIVGAGSVITRDVPADALAVERSDQRTLEGMGKKLNEKNAAKAKKS